MEYEYRDPYKVERHNNAIDLNFKYIGGDKYTLPRHWGDDTIVVDLSATGKEQFQILQSVILQLIGLIARWNVINPPRKMYMKTIKNLKVSRPK